jgi:hypothetical protein
MATRKTEEHDLSGAPRVRAGLAQQSLRTLRALDEELRDAVLRELDAAFLARIEAASPEAWLPLLDDIALIEALYRQVQAAEHRRLWRRAMLDNLSGPVLGPVFHVAAKLEGKTPPGLARFAPDVWGALFQDAGQLKVGNVSDSEALLVLEGAPSEMLASDALIQSIAGTFEAAIEWTGSSGRVEIRRGGVGRLEFAFSFDI